jgi:hypothetical protein
VFVPASRVAAIQAPTRAGGNGAALLAAVAAALAAPAAPAAVPAALAAPAAIPAVATAPTVLAPAAAPAAPPVPAAAPAAARESIEILDDSSDDDERGVKEVMVDGKEVLMIDCGHDEEGGAVTSAPAKVREGAQCVFRAGIYQTLVLACVTCLAVCYLGLRLRL